MRPFEIVEMDKAAEKMIAAYIIGKFEENEGRKLNWEWMIYSSLFYLLKKISLCDIKSPVQQMIRQRYPDEYRKINGWIFSQYKDIIGDEELLSMFSGYCGGTQNLKDNETILAERVLQAAHRFSSLRELQLIEPVNEKERITKIKEAFGRG